MKDLELKLFEAVSFMGIDAENPIVIDFTSARKGQAVTKLTGDQGVGKSSTMMALMYLMGAAFNIESKHLKNIKDETIDLSLEFEHEDSKYKVEASGTRITLKKYFTDADKFITVGEPKATLKKIFGNLGASPMFLKEMDGKKQIQWFKETFGNDEDATKKEQKLVANIDTVFAQRRDVNRDIKNLKGALETEPLYQSYEKSQERFKKPVSAEKEKKTFDELAEKKAEYDKAIGGLDRIRNEQSRQKTTIKDLEGKLAAEKEALQLAEKRLLDGNKYIADNKDIPEKYAAANEAWLNLSKTLADHEKWKSVLKKEKEFIEMQEASIQADGVLDGLRMDLLKLTKTYLPDIEGLEIRVKTGIDDADEGIYYGGKSLAQLSESEIWDLFELIWEQKEVYFVFCENINALGSEAVKTLNRLVKDKKAQVFATQMDRSKDEMNISFATKIE